MLIMLYLKIQINSIVCPAKTTCLDDVLINLCSLALFLSSIQVLAFLLIIQMKKSSEIVQTSFTSEEVAGFAIISRYT